MSTWETDSDDRLYSIAELDGTPLGFLPRRTRYRLVSKGELPALTIGRRRYVRRAAVRLFLELREQAVAATSSG